MRRVFFLDALRCVKCGAQMKILSFLTDPAVITRILDHAGLPSKPPPLAPVRAVRLPFWDASEGEEVGADGSGDREEDPIGERSPP